MRFAAAVAFACVLLAGCRTTQPGAAMPNRADPVAAAAAQQSRAEALGLANGDCCAPGWTMTGRVALSNGKDGGSGQLEWTQGGGNLHLLLSAPITRQNWILDVDAQGATLHGVANGPLHGDDAARLLREAGYALP